MTAPSVKRLPQPDGLTQPFWDAARGERLLVQRCLICRRTQFYPRGHCASCFAPEPDWIEASGLGRVHSFTITYRNQDPAFADDCPYVLALVELEEGPTLTGNVVGIPPEEVKIGMPVRAVFTQVAEDVLLPQFAPIGGP